MNRINVARASACRAWLLSAVIGGLLGAVPGLAESDDFDHDGNWDIDDIDLLVGEIINGTNHPDFNLTTEDILVDLDDLAEWLEIAGVGNGFEYPGYSVGDANLDGTVDGVDEDIVRAHLGTSPNTWSGGDFNADGIVNSLDLDALGLTFGITLDAVNPGEIGWAPLTMDFGVLTVGDSAEQTLTLTNTAADGTLIITNIRFTFNQQGAYSVTPFDYAFLAPGESTAVGFTFVPPEFSFFMADARILSNATNASSLTYSMLGMGDTVLICPDPQTDCGGFCVLLDDNVFHCGSCDNACSPPPNGTAYCAAGSCGFTCNEGYEPDGDGCSPILVQLPAEMLAELTATVLEYAEGGSLDGLGPPSTDDDHPVVVPRLESFIRFLDNAATNGFAVGDEETACALLNAAQLRSDDLGGPQDFVTGEAKVEVNQGIIDIMAAMDGCEIRQIQPFTP